jgi:signal transduction histidine kinase
VGQVPDNLLENALRDAPAEGVIRIECSEVTRDQEPALRICVRDEGPGIPEDLLGRIFLPFYQPVHGAGRQLGGAGPGLAICRRIVDANGGRIWAESAPGRGAEFVVDLPVAMPMTYHESRWCGLLSREAA